MPIIAISSGKGGTGKTATAFSLAELWKIQGRSVAIIDCDPNENLTNWFIKRTNDAQEVSEDGSLVDGIKWVSEMEAERIVDVADELSQSHDFVIIDVAGVQSTSLLYSAGIADLVIIPAQPSEDDVIEAVKTRKVVRNASKLTKRDIEYRVLVTRVKQTKAYQFALGQISAFDLPKFETEIKDLTIFKEARFCGSSPEGMEPKSDAAALVRQLAKEIETIVSL